MTQTLIKIKLNLIIFNQNHKDCMIKVQDKFHPGIFCKDFKTKFQY